MKITNTVPAFSVITSATLRLFVTTGGIQDSDLRSIQCEYYSSTNWPITTASYSDSPGADAVAGTALGTLSANQYNSLTLINLTSIVANSTTGLRCSISGGQPTSINSLSWYSADEGQAAFLNICYIPGSTPTPTITQTATSTPTETPTSTNTPTNTPTATKTTTIVPASTPTATSPAGLVANTPTLTPVKGVESTHVNALELSLFTNSTGKVALPLYSQDCIAESYAPASYEIDRCRCVLYSERVGTTDYLRLKCPDGAVHQVFP